MLSIRRVRQPGAAFFQTRWWIHRNARGAHLRQSACRKKPMSCCAERQARRVSSSLFRRAGAPRKPPKSEVRRLVTPRDELRPAYLNTQGLRVGKSGDVLQVKEKDTLRQQIRLNEINQLNLMGNIQVSTQAVQALAQAEVPVCYFSQGGWFYGITQGLSTKNVFLRKAQFRLAEEEWFCLRLARKLTAGKIRNQRTMLMRNHEEPPPLVLDQMRTMAQRAEEAETLEQLLGIEGNGARLYFGEFSGMLKADEDEPEDPGSPSIFKRETGGRREIRSTRCFRWATACSRKI